jgi:hypothetical protein
MTPEEFEALPRGEQLAAIEHNDEHVRQWRAVCQLCKRPVSGTLAEIRRHECDGDT